MVFYGFLGYKTPKNLNAQLLMNMALSHVNWRLLRYLGPIDDRRALVLPKTTSIFYVTAKETIGHSMHVASVQGEILSRDEKSQMSFIDDI